MALQKHTSWLLVLILPAFLLALGSVPARADSFPSTLPSPPVPRYSGIRAFYLDEHGGNLLLGAGQLRLEGFYRCGVEGLAVDLQWQYLPGYTPAVMDGRTAWQAGLATHELNLGVGWRFGNESIGITPLLNLRDLFSSGAASDQMWAVGPGAILEYHLYPETTTLQVRYRHHLPFTHSGSGPGPDLASSRIPLLDLDVRIAYRVLRSLEMSAGFHLWQLPSDLGRGRLLTKDTVWLRGFYIGTGVLF